MTIYDEIYQEFIGKDKVQAVKVMEKNGRWVLQYKEGKKRDEIECEDRETLDKILIEFGGKNPETCSAVDDFLKLNKSWTSDTLNDLGHRITKVRFNASRVTRKATFPIILPEGCGHYPIVNAKKNDKDSINIMLIDKESTVFTRAFKTRQEFDNLQDFIFSNVSLNKLDWHVMLLGTESRDPARQCVWKRLKAGDGTKRMILELIGLDGAHYTDCVRQDLYNAAGDMFENACQRISMKKKKEQTIEICMFAAEDGKVDISGLEVAG